MYSRYSALFPNMLITPGVKAFCENNSCFWLLDVVCSYQADDKVTKDEALTQIQFWQVRFSEDDELIPSDGCRVCCDRDTDDTAFFQDIPFTDLNQELDSRLWVTPLEGSLKVIMRPSEY